MSGNWLAMSSLILGNFDYNVPMLSIVFGIKCNILRNIAPTLITMLMIHSVSNRENIFESGKEMLILLINVRWDYQLVLAMMLAKFTVMLIMRG